MGRRVSTRAAWFLFPVIALLIGNTSAEAQSLPPVDDFLGVRILTAGASTPGGPVTVTNSAPISKFGLTEAGLAVTNLSGGYDDLVLDPIRNFSAAGYAFTTIGVSNANGIAGTVGSPVTGHRV